MAKQGAKVTVLALIGFVCGMIGLMFGLRCYLELWRWARQCQGAQIAIARKRKVQLSAPLVEWLLWCNNLEGRDESGRVVYRNGDVTVAVIRKPTGQRRWRVVLPKRQRGQTAPRVGAWRARDETKGVASR